ncbi:MAG: DUF6498-containing protein [Woeseia sp.]
MFIPNDLTRLDAQLTVAKELGLGALGLLVANAAMLLCFFAYDLTLFQLVLVFWCECLWIGVASAGKLIAASIVGNPYENQFAEISAGASFMMSLFVIFFTSSIFFSLLGMTLMAILYANDALAPSTPGDDLLNHIGPVLGVSYLLLAGHLLSFVSNFLVLGEYKYARMGPLMALPFKRCLALLMAIAVSIGFIALMPRFASTSGFAVMVIVLKVVWDLRLHVGERGQFSGEKKQPIEV